MTFDPSRHHRRSIRIKAFDYGQAGAYYLTLGTAGRRRVLGDIVEGEMVLNEIGRIVQEEWLRSAEMRPRVSLDAFVVMPNHLHGIILLDDPDTNAEIGNDVGARRVTLQRDPLLEQFGKPTSDTIPTITRLFKSAATKRVNILRGTPGAPLWQRNYYEHVVRDQQDLDRIRKYIAENPARWEEDRENPNKR